MSDTTDLSLLHLVIMIYHLFFSLLQCLQAGWQTTMALSLRDGLWWSVRVLTGGCGATGIGIWVEWWKWTFTVMLGATMMSPQQFQHLQVHFECMYSLHWLCKLLAEGVDLHFSHTNGLFMTTYLLKIQMDHSIVLTLTIMGEGVNELFNQWCRTLLRPPYCAVAIVTTTAPTIHAGTWSNEHFLCSCVCPPLLCVQPIIYTTATISSTANTLVFHHIFHINQPNKFLQDFIHT